MLKGPESLVWFGALGAEHLKQRGLIRRSCKDHFESSVENGLEGGRSDRREPVGSVWYIRMDVANGQEMDCSSRKGGGGA